MVIPDYDGSEDLAGLLFGGPALYDNNDAKDPDSLEVIPQICLLVMTQTF